MSKEELYPILDTAMIKARESGDYNSLPMEIIVAAYNKAIDDAFERVWDLLEVGGDINLSVKEELKIRD